MKPKIPKEIKKLCNNFNKGTEDWEDYFPREIQALISFLKTRLLEELPKERKENIFPTEEIGFNTCLSQVRQIINKVFEE